MTSNCRCNNASYDHGTRPEPSTLIRVGWILVVSTAAIVVPLRVAEIVVANQMKTSFCAVASDDAYRPTFAVSHSAQYQGNLKDESEKPYTDAQHRSPGRRLPRD
jgi:hypothetical protein